MWKAHRQFVCRSKLEEEGIRSGHRSAGRCQGIRPLVCKGGRQGACDLNHCVEVGSIADNRLGGWVSYRSSKAALNMILKTLAIEHARRFPEAVIAGLHPGTVDSALSAPFQRRVPDGKLFSPTQSVDYMLSVIDRLTAADTGGFFAWDGNSIDY